MVRLLNSTVEPILSSLLIVVIVTVVLSRVVQSRVLCESRDKQTRGLPLTQPPPQGCLPILVTTVRSHTHNRSEMVKGSSFYIPAKNGLKNFADVSTRVPWSSSGLSLPRRRPEHSGQDVRGKVFSPSSSWYRRTLYSSCNSQLRSSHFTTDQCSCNGAVLKQRQWLLGTSEMQCSECTYVRMCTHHTRKAYKVTCGTLRGQRRGVTGNQTPLYYSKPFERAPGETVKDETWLTLSSHPVSP